MSQEYTRPQISSQENRLCRFAFLAHGSAGRNEQCRLLIAVALLWRVRRIHRRWCPYLALHLLLLPSFFLPFQSRQHSSNLQRPRLRTMSARTTPSTSTGSRCVMTSSYSQRCTSPRMRRGGHTQCSWIALLTASDPKEKIIIRSILGPQMSSRIRATASSIKMCAGAG